MTYFNFKLRPYQESAPEQVRLAMVSGAKSVLGIAPTGSGKSVIFTYFAILAALKKKTVTILTHRRELLNNAGSLTRGKEGVEVVMVETFWNALKRGKAWPDLLIIDEAHIGNFKKIVKAKPQSTFLFGLTATPIMSAKDEKLSDYYDTMIELTTIEECIANNWLCNYRHISPEYSINGDSLSVEKGEYTPDSLVKALGHTNVEKSLINTVAQLKEKVIVFGVNIKHTEHLAKILNADYCVHSNTPDREEQVEAYLKRKDRCIMVNCGILTTGFDDPSIQHIVLVRKTKSLALFLQMIGRGSRLHHGKRHFTVWDFGKNYEEHGLWNVKRDWMYIFKNNKKNPREMIAPSKSCKSCNAIIPANAKTCQYCGAVCETKAKKPEVVEVIGMKEITVGSVSSELVNIALAQKERDYKAGWAYRQVKSLAAKIARPLREIAEQYAKTIGYKPNWWVWHRNNENVKKQTK